MLNIDPKDVLSKVSEIGVAILIIVVGLFIINKLVKGAQGAMERSKMDETLKRFLGNMLGVVLKILLFISVAQTLGFETTSFAALLGAAGLAVGMALQGSLSNFAGGVMTMIFKPFKVGDLTDAQGHFGEVKEIGIFVTKILTQENKTVIIPNGPLSNGIITNVTEKGYLRVDLTVAVANNVDINHARQVILEAMRNTPKVLKDPAPVVFVSELAPDMVKLAVRPHAKPEEYWDVYFGVLENVRKALNTNNIEGPTPTRIIINK